MTLTLSFLSNCFGKSITPGDRKVKVRKIPTISYQIEIQSVLFDSSYLFIYLVIYLFVYLFIYLCIIYLFIYLFSFAQRGGSPQQREPITVGPYYLTHPVKFLLWEETGVPGENLKMNLY